MQEPTLEKSRESGPAPERMTALEFLIQVLAGIGVMLGLALLWLMEIFRDAFFRILDRLNIKPRHHRRPSAFPPGQPRQRPPASAAG